MLTHHRKPVLLSLISTDLPVRSVVETTATLEQKDHEKFNLLLTEPFLPQQEPAQTTAKSPPLLWLEISPYRVIMTRQTNGQLNYRHFWEQGVYGNSKYWLNCQDSQAFSQLRLRNFTRSLSLIGSPLPHQLRVEYELWSDKLRLGQYVLSLEIY